MSLHVGLLILSLAAVGSAPADLGSRIVNGEPVDIREVPYQASLRTARGSGWTHLCGAVIVSAYAVLTAAHCVEGAEDPSIYRVVVGTSYREVGGREHAVSAVTVYPQYRDLVNDIAVIRVSTPFTFGSTVQPIPLAPAGTDLPVGTKALVSGFGTLYYAGPSSRVLMAAEVTIVSQQYCAERYASLDTLLPSMLCANSVEPSRDACQGDSGGPLVAEGILLGLVSWGEGCGDELYPGVYTRVSEFSDWVAEVIAE